MADVVRSPSEPDSIELKSNKVAFTPTPTGRRVEVVINRTYEQDQMLRSQQGSPIEVEGRRCKKPVRRAAIDDDVENDAERPTRKQVS